MLSGGIQENMIDLPVDYPPDWVGMSLLGPLLYAWSFEWLTLTIGLMFGSAVFLTVCVGIMGGSLRSAPPLQDVASPMDSYSVLQHFSNFWGKQFTPTRDG